MILSNIEAFLNDLQYKIRYNLTVEECKQAISETCQFFGIPLPVFIQDLTNRPDEGTCFKNRDANSLYDDVLGFDLEQLRGLGVTDYVSFSAVMTHECAHRVFQNRLLPGPAFGQWEHELVADYFMGVRAALQNMNIGSIIEALSKTRGSGSHPTGTLRREYIIYGKQEGYYHLIHNKKADVEEYFQLFLDYREQHLKELYEAEMRVY